MIPLIHGFIKINNFKHKKKHFQLSMCVIINTICTPVKLCNAGEKGVRYVCMLYRTRYKGGGGI